jgi:ribose 5-phosphate isomerase B
MRVHLGSDHAGFALKAAVIAELKRLGHDPVDHGAVTYIPEDDYPGPCFAAAEAAISDPGSLAIVFGGSGNGEAIAANKVRGARCAVAYSDETARLARAHNDANILSLGARMLSEADALRLVGLFISTTFSGEERHVRRIAELATYEERRRASQEREEEGDGP